MLRVPPITTETVTPRKERPRHAGPGGGLGEPWRVVVVNDNHNTFQGVAAALAAVVPGITYDKGMALANRIHSTGQAIVWSGHKERAEHYWQELRSRDLTMAPLER